MRVLTIAAVLASLILGTAGLAQVSTDPSGHWEGTISMPFGELRFEIDLVRDDGGQTSGTLSIPDQKLRGFPLSSITVDERTLTFSIRTGRGATFRGTISVDGRSMTGSATSPEGEAPFRLERTGAAQVIQTPKGPPIAPEFEGVWNGTVDVNGGLRVVLRLTNHADGTATGTLVSVDEGGLEIPVEVTHERDTLRVNAAMVGSTYLGRLNASGTELTGTYTLRDGTALALILRRDR